MLIYKHISISQCLCIHMCVSLSIYIYVFEWLLVLGDRITTDLYFFVSFFMFSCFLWVNIFKRKKYNFFKCKNISRVLCIHKIVVV